MIPTGRIRWRRARLALAAALLAGAATAPALAASYTLAPSHTLPPRHASGARSRLRDIALTADAREATINLAFTAAVRPRLLRLHAPERLVIDLPRTWRGAALPPVPADALITRLRAAERHGRDLRLVLELRARPTAVHLQWLAGTDGAALRIALRAARPGTAAGEVATTTTAPTSATPAPAATAAISAAPAASAASALRGIRALHAPSGQRDVIVAVDAGHGGVDPGASGPDGTHEKDVTLAIARALAARIDRAPGMRAVLTRDGDYFVALRDRMERARAAHADLFISIHADSVRDQAIGGASVYILSERGASSEAARRLADEENAADLKGGISLAAQAPDLRSVLLNLSQSASIGQSGEAAQDVLGALASLGEVRKREVQQAAFVVLKSPDVPSMLVETAYISNPSDERRLRDPQQQRRLAEAIFSGIDGYFRQYPPQGTLFARARGRTAAPAAAS